MAKPLSDCKMLTRIFMVLAKLNYEQTHYTGKRKKSLKKILTLI